MILSPEEIDVLSQEYPEQIKATIWDAWQSNVLVCLHNEIGLFGGKGSGKSTLGRGFLIKGNPDLPDVDEMGRDLLYNRSYTYHPDYYALILRKNEKDLSFFKREAQKMWAPLGAEYNSGGYFQFPSGARIDCGHMANEDSWTKYIGNEYMRIFIDEAGLIPEFGPIEEMISCMRTPLPEIRRQIMYASNCGGKGTHWIIDRFMNVKDKDGEIITHDTPIVEDRIHPFSGRAEKWTRIWIFATVKDNVHLRDTSYATDLAYLQDPKRRAAYFEGRWDALFGSYFGDIFRPNGPNLSNNEPSNANHVIRKGQDTGVKPWHPITMGGDWGYAHQAAFLWSRQSTNKRVIIYREMAVERVSPERLGFDIATLSRPDLEVLPSHSFTLWLGHDAFRNDRGDRSIAELIAVGISRVLGAKAVHLPDLMIKNIKDSWMSDAFNMEDRQKQQEAIDAILLQKRMGITIRIAERTGITGWQYVRELMQWEEIEGVNAQRDPQLMMKLLQTDPKAFEEYANVFKDLQVEARPRLQILESCSQLITALPKAQHEDGTENIDRAHFRGKDIVDALSYLTSGLKVELPKEPFESFREKRLEEYHRMYGDGLTTNDLCRVHTSLESEWKQKSAPTPSMMVPRITTWRRARRQSRNPYGTNVDEILKLR